MGKKLQNNVKNSEIGSAPGKYLRNLCAGLGEGYRIDRIDYENVITRDLGCGFDIEVSGADKPRPPKLVTIYLWKDRSHTVGDPVRVSPAGIAAVADRWKVMYAAE